MTDERLIVLRREERQLNREWELAAWREDWTEAARIRTAYNMNFDRLLSHCREPRIVER